MTISLTKQFRQGTDVVFACLGLAAAVAVLISPALWNGFPFLFYDSIDYLLLPFIGTMPEWRTAAYGFVNGVGRLTGDLWSVLVAQSLLTLIAGMLSLGALRAALQNDSGPAPRSSRLIWLGAAVAGGLPFYAAQLMPDLFAGITILGLLALMLAPDRLNRWQRWLLLLLTALATACHTSHIGIGCGLLLLAVVGRIVSRQVPLPENWQQAFPRTGPAAGSMVLAIILAVTANGVITGRLLLTQPASIQMLGLYVENGLAARYLDAVCTTASPPPHRLCLYRDQLPDTANMFLWGQDSPLDDLGGWHAARGEAEAVVAGATRMFPWSLVWSSIQLTARQLVWVNPGDGLAPMQSFMREPIRRWYPDHDAAFMAARQQSKVLDFSDFNLETQLVAGLSGLVLAAGLVIAWRRRAPRLVLFAGLVLAALLGNAIICGALSNPNMRYQGRVVWLQAVASVLLLQGLAAQSRGRGAIPVPAGDPSPALQRSDIAAGPSPR